MQLVKSGYFGTNTPVTHRDLILQRIFMYAVIWPKTVYAKARLSIEFTFQRQRVSRSKRSFGFWSINFMSALRCEETTGGES